MGAGRAASGAGRRFAPLWLRCRRRPGRIDLHRQAVRADRRGRGGLRGRHGPGVPGRQLGAGAQGRLGGGDRRSAVGSLERAAAEHPACRGRGRALRGERRARAAGGLGLGVRRRPRPAQRGPGQLRGLDSEPEPARRRQPAGSVLGHRQSGAEHGHGPTGLVRSGDRHLHERGRHPDHRLQRQCHAGPRQRGGGQLWLRQCFGRATGQRLHRLAVQ